MRLPPIYAGYGGGAQGIQVTKCPECGYRLVRNRGTETAFMPRIIAKAEGLFVVCPKRDGGCGAQIPMPSDMKKSLGLIMKIGA
jgi:DNA-directed RNA polymerase subunit RPC12/RpoP